MSDFPLNFIIICFVIAMVILKWKIVIKIFRDTFGEYFKEKKGD